MTLATDPALLAERMKSLPLQAEQKTCDRVIMLLFLTALPVLRTHLENRSPQCKLEGYTEYVGKTRYRLFPGIW